MTNALCSRLGANYFKLAVNRPKVPLNQPHIRDGLCADYENGGPEPNYYPSTNEKTSESDRQTMPAFSFGEEELRRYNSLYEDNYSQVRVSSIEQLAAIITFQVAETWMSFSPEEQSRVALRIAAQLSRAEKIIREPYLDEVKKVSADLYHKIIDNLRTISLDLGNRIINGINIDAVRAFHSSSM